MRAAGAGLRDARGAGGGRVRDRPAHRGGRVPERAAGDDGPRGVRRRRGARRRASTRRGRASGWSARPTTRPAASARCAAPGGRTCASERQSIGTHVDGAFDSRWSCPRAGCTASREGLDAPAASMAEPLACVCQSLLDPPRRRRGRPRARARARARSGCSPRRWRAPCGGAVTRAGRAARRRAAGAGRASSASPTLVAGATRPAGRTTWSSSARAASRGSPRRWRSAAAAAGSCRSACAARR